MPSRRLFGKRLLTLGGLSMLTGCSLTDDESVNRFLTAVSRLNDRAQAALFDPKRLAPTYTEAQLTRPFPFNAYYGIDEVPQVDGSDYKLTVSGLIADKRPWTVEQLYELPQETQITEHVCVEGWSMIGKWTGTPLRIVLEKIGADTTAKYVGFMCADGYYESMDMPTALHPQTLLTFSYDGEQLPAKYGFPMKLRMPTKLGYKNPKHIVEMFVTNTFPGGYWVDQGYNWFGGS
jgi:DMSO/TMAO reductase YedYZ molybdopterin-dependent catalytic subunit